MYKNEEYLKRTIMEQSRHLFIYGYATKERSEFLQSLEALYPMTNNHSEPVALYFDSFGLPRVETDIKNKDIYMLHTMSREYLSFLIASEILAKTIKSSENNLDDKLARLIKLTNIGRNQNHDKITYTTDLLEEFKISRDFYYENYINYVNGVIGNVSTDDIALPFLNLEMFVSQYKRCMDMKSYFGIVLDKKSQLSSFSVQVVNNFIGARINSDISIKVATEPDDWETYHCANWGLIEGVHDYGTIELDESYRAYAKKLRRPIQY